MTDDRLQRIEEQQDRIWEVLNRMDKRQEVSLAQSDSRQANCLQRFDRIEKSIERHAVEIDGNGKKGLKARVGENETNVNAIMQMLNERKEISKKTIWSIVTFVQAVAILVIKYVLP